MSAYIYCLYSTADGLPRYVGTAPDKVSHTFKVHVAAALDKEGGAIYEWMRDTWRGDFDVAPFILQEGIASADEELFEAYWTTQFVDLLNASAGQSKGPRVNSPVALQVIAAIRAQLEAMK